MPSANQTHVVETIERPKMEMCKTTNRRFCGASLEKPNAESWAPIKAMLREKRREAQGFVGPECASEVAVCPVEERL